MPAPAMPANQIARLLRRRSLPALAWAIATYCYKRTIRRQDERRRYTYADWIRTVEQPRLEQARNSAPAARLRVGVVMAALDLAQPDLQETLASLEPQALDWHLVCLLPEQAVCRGSDWFRALQAGLPNITVITAEAGFDPVQWAAYVDWMPGDWLLSIAPGTRMASAWGDLLCRRIALAPDTEIAYWDEDVLDSQRRRSQPFFKPDWSLELLYARNYLRGAAFRASYLLASPVRGAPGGLLDAALAAKQVAHIPFVLAHQPAAELVVEQVQHAAGLQAHLRRRRLTAAVVEVNTAGVIRASWQSDQPLVSVIIPTRDHLEDIRRCLSGLLKATSYPRLEIILMDDHTRDPAVLAYYQQVLAEHENVSLVHNPSVFNYSRVNNHGARLARGDLLLFLNNDVEVVQPGWLAELVRWVLLPGVGMVGPKLVYPGGKVQHAGVVIGMTGHANHVCQGAYPPTEPRFDVDWVRNVSAVTGACMLARRQVFEAAGGFDESLALVFNDVELCQRVLRAGQRIVYVPAACLVHHEGRTRGRAIPPHDLRSATLRLSDCVARGDPYYNPNLSLAVNWPTFRRASDPDPLAQLQAVDRYFR